MREQITQAINDALLIFLQQVEHPYDINCGLCEDFAIHVIEALQGKETDTLYMVWIEDLIDTPFPDANHAVILWESENGTVYFDAECPDGTKDISSIPAMANVNKTRGEVIFT